MRLLKTIVALLLVASVAHATDVGLGSVDGLTKPSATGTSITPNSCASGVAYGIDASGVLTCAAAPDDNILIGNGTSWVATVVGDCNGADQALTYDTATNAIGCNTISSGGGSPAPPDKSIQFNDSGSFGGNADFEFEKTYTSVPAPRLTHRMFTNNMLLEMDEGELNVFATVGSTFELNANPFLVATTVYPDGSGTFSGQYAVTNGIFDTAIKSSGGSSSSVVGLLSSTESSGGSMTGGHVIAVYGSNSLRSPSSTLNLSSSTPPVGAFGVYGDSIVGGADGPGLSVGTYGRGGGSGSDIGIGVFGQNVSGSSGTEIGVLGNGGGGAGSGLVSVGGLFTLYTALPTDNVSVALLAQTDFSADIFRAYDQSTLRNSIPSSGGLRFFETGGGGNYVAFNAPASIGSDVTWTLPSVDSTGEQALVSNGSATLSWQSFAKFGWTSGAAADDVSANTTTYFNVMGQNPVNTEAVSQMIIPADETFSALYCRSTLTPGAGKTFTYTARKNGAGTTLTCQVADAAMSCNDTTHSFSVTAGDVIAFQIVTSAGATATTHSCGMRYSAS